ncbi:MAG: CotH kinase family protein, partial [Clostridia bacterium]|nr:CotH kinase family protein [Clostridia bacterium]
DKSQNSWMLYDVTFADSDNGRVWTSNEEHPSLVGCEVKLTLEWVGDSLTFNGKAFKDGDKVTLKETNELIVYADNELTKAEYTIVIKEETRGLPVVLIDTNNAPIPDKLNYVDASISVLGSEVYGSKSQNIYSAVAGIKLRGNSTMGYAKKPYRIKFDKKQNVLGLGKAKSWVLLADYLDPSSLRNTIAYNFAERVNATTAALTGKAQVFAPRMKLVEVYLNGQFQGLYEMGDHMQANELRVPVNELGDEDDPDQYDSEDIGFFIEVEVKDRVLKEGKPGYEDWSAYSYITDIGADAGSDGIYAQVINDKDKNQYLIDESDMGKSVLYFQFKLPEDPTDKHKAYITDYMQQVNDLILANDERVWDLVDLDSVVNWYIVNELFKNADSQMQSSVYFYKHGSTDIDGNDADGKLYMAPVWDFDLGAGGVTYGDMDDPTEWRTRNDEYCGWFRELFETTTFSNAVDARWALLRNNGSFDLLFNDIATYSSTYKEAAEADFALWHDSYVREVNATSWLTVPNVALTGDWPAQVSYLQYWLYQRMMWMDTGFGYTNTPWQENEVLTGQKLANIFNNYTIYAPQDGNCIVKIPMDLNIPIDRMAIDMDFSCNVPFNLKFATPYHPVYSGVSFSKAGNLAGDWSNDAALGSNKPSNGRVPAGTYKGLRPTLSGVFTWTLGGSNYSSYTGLTGTQGANSATIGKNLKNYLKSAYLTEIQIEFFGAAAGQSAATFTINMYDQNYDIRENVSGYDPIPDSKAFSQTVIGGAPFIAGEPKVGNTLTISTVGITPYNADVHYLWYVDGKAVASDSPTTYVVKASDFGKQISAKVVGVFK